jgi:hypothetical protein
VSRHAQHLDFPRREVLEALARRYHHLEGEHERDRPEGEEWRRHEHLLLEVRERFERLLAEWVPDLELREAWRRYLGHRGPEPPGPSPIPRLVFRGRSRVTGSVAEVYATNDGEVQVEVDGASVGRAAAEKDFAATQAPIRFRLDDREFVETFRVSPAALAALDAFVEDGGSPPWEHAVELFADGLIDLHFDLTPRGRRALARARRRGAGKRGHSTVASARRR